MNFTGKISIVIPAYNEQDRIEASLEKIIDFQKKHELDIEILVVDDGSTDKTIEVAQANQVTVIPQVKNQGKGAAVRRGMLEASGEVVIFSDADLSTPIYELEKLTNTINEGFDIAIGSRALQNELIKEHQPWYREFMGKSFNRIVQRFVMKGIKDTQCGFKAFKKECAKKVFSNSKIDGFAFDVEALYLANKFNFTIKEVPVEWYNDDRSKVNPITDSINMLLEISRIKRLHKDL